MLNGSSALKLLTRDVAVKATTKCGQFRVVVATTRSVLHQTMTRHSLYPSGADVVKAAATDVPVYSDTPAETALPQLGNIITTANLFAALLNSEERVRVEFHGTHATAVAESLALGETRAFLQPIKAIDGATTGVLKVQRALYGQTVPFISATVAEGTSASDLSLAVQVQHHCAQSDGVPAAVFLATSFDPVTGLPAFNAGVLVQPIAPSENRTQEALEVIGTLQRSFRCLMVDDEDEMCAAGFDPAAVRSLRGSLSRRLFLGFGIHDLMGLTTGDWLAARRICDGARQLGSSGSRRLLEAQLSNTPGPADSAEGDDIKKPPRDSVDRSGKSEASNTDEIQATIRRVLAQLPELPTDTNKTPYGESTIISVAARKGRTPETGAPWLGWDPSSHGSEMMAIDESTIVRTPLDFHCRCSKGGFMSALRAVGLDGVQARRSANPDMDFKCMHCMRVWRLEPSDWDAVEASMQSTNVPASNSST